MLLYIANRFLVCMYPKYCTLSFAHEDGGKYKVELNLSQQFKVQLSSV